MKRLLREYVFRVPTDEDVLLSFVQLRVQQGHMQEGKQWGERTRQALVDEGGWRVRSHTCTRSCHQFESIEQGMVLEHQLLCAPSAG